MGSLLDSHFYRYPLMQVQDLYKLLHQAALGSEHAVLDETGAQKWLESELATMGDGPDEPLLDPISPDGSIARLHLRPCLVAGVDPQAILAAFLGTARAWHGSLETLRDYGRLAVLFAEQETCPITGREISFVLCGHGKGRLSRPASFT